MNTRTTIYAESIIYDLSGLDDNDYELISDAQELTDACARSGILTGETLEKVRNAIAEKTEVTDIDYSDIGYGHKVDTALDINVNGKKFKVTLNRVKSVPQDLLWTEIGDGYEVAVIKDGDGNEQLVFCYSTYNDKNGKRGSKVYGVTHKTTGGELYNALVNKYRGVGTKKN